MEIIYLERDEERGIGFTGDVREGIIPEEINVESLEFFFDISQVQQLIRLLANQDN